MRAVNGSSLIVKSNKQKQLRPGARNTIADVEGILVGHASSQKLKSGTTVLTADVPFRASVDVMGGAPGTRETDCLAPDRLVDAVDALVLSGGSAFGLDAASGVADALRDAGRGFAVGPVSVPIVPAAILFDLLNGGRHDWARNPYRSLGVKALKAAGQDFLLGSVGAGTGATTANLKGGLGSASVVLPNGMTVGAIVAVNPHGSAVAGDRGEFHAAPFELDNEFGGLGAAPATRAAELPKNEKLIAYESMRSNTTIAIVATDADLSKAQLKRFAIAAQDGIARALLPSHTPFDGDLIFSLSTAARPLDDQWLDPMLLGHAAALGLSRAIARGIFHATPAAGDTLPTWTERFLYVGS